MAEQIQKEEVECTIEEVIKIDLLNDVNDKIIFYNLNFRLNGNMYVAEGMCSKCKKKNQVAYFGEYDYGFGKACKECIFKLFENTKN